MSKRRSYSRLRACTSGPRSRAIARLAAAAALALSPVARAGSYYWTGDHDSNWNTTGGAAGTNWSSSPDFNNDPLTLPGSSDNVFFVLFGAGNLNTALGQNFSINSLNFTPDAVAANTINIGGANLLTLGAGGLVDNSPATISLSSNVAVGAAETWQNNSTVPLTISGVVSGSSNLNLIGTGATGGSATGAFVFQGANSYSGQITVNNAQSSLTINGNGSFAGITNTTAGITLNGGSSLILDNTVTNSSTRLASTVGITSLGGMISLLGNASAPTAQSAGTLAIGAGATYVTVTPGSGQSAALTFGAAGGSPSFSHVTGGTVTFSSTGTIQAPNVTLIDPTNPIIGGWATIGITSNPAGPLDWATVVGGNVVPLATYQPLTANPAATDNSQLLAAGGTVTLSAGNHTINSLSIGGTLLFNTTANVLTITSGGIISYGGTGTATFQGGTYRPVSNMADIGQTLANANAGPNPEYIGNITSGTSDLTIFTAGNLQLSSVITGNINLVKSGPGVLDLSTGNDQNNKTANTYTGITTINEGTIILDQEAQLGAAPTSLVANAITFNGGQLEAFSSIVFSANRGITVGTRGGTIFGVAGTGDQLPQPITGPGGITLWTDGYLATAGGAAGRILLNNASTIHPNNYQGPTTFLVTPDWNSTTTFDTTTVTATQGTIQFGQNNNVPSTSAVTANLVDQNGNVLPNPYGPAGTLRYYFVNMGGFSESFGSLAGNLALINMTGTLTLGANNLSTTYSGVIGGTSSTTSINLGTGSIVKVGSGTQTFSGANQYTGTTKINGGTLLIGSGTATTSTASLANTTVTVGNGSTLSGALGGNGTIGGAVTVTSTGSLAPAMSPTTTNTLTINNSLTLNAGATLSFNFGAAGSPGTGDLVNLTGTGSASLLAGQDTLNITPLSGFGIGTYNLITVSGTGTLADNATFTINGTTTFNYAVAASGNNLVLNVTAGNPFYFWSGAVAGTPNGSWDLSTANWSGAATTYSDGGNVTFDDVDLAIGGATNVTVAAGGVSPNSITFNNSANNYAFSGAAINVATSIIKNQAGNATFNNTVTTPLTTVAGGSLTVGGAGVFNSSTSVVVQSGATLTVNGTLNTPLLTLNAGAAGLSVASTGSLASTTALVANAPATFNSAAQTLASLTDTSGATTGAITLNGTTLTLSATSGFDGTITGTGSLAVTGGTLTLSNGVNTYSGGTTLSGAGTTLLVTNTTGTAAGSGAVTVGNGAVLGGSGIVTAPVTVNTGGTLAGTGSFGGTVTLNGVLSPAGAGTVGTITLGSLASTGGATFNYDFGAPANSDTATVNGALSLSGADTLNINGLNGFVPGKYVLATATGAITDTATFSFNPTGAPPVFNYAVQVIGNTLDLVVTATSTTWTGFTNGSWDTTTANWSPSPTGTFTNFQPVIFDDTGTNTTITVIAAGVNTSGITFNNSTKTYTIGGGPIGGTGGLVKNNAGLVILTGANTYSGGTTINGGTLQLGNAAANGTFGTGTYAIGGGARLFLDYAMTVAPAWANISGGGTLELSTAAVPGPTTSDWGQAAFPATFTGTLQIDQGRVYTSTTPASLGNATNVVVAAGAQFGTFFLVSPTNTFTQNLTIAGTGYGEATFESALRLANAGSTTTLTGTVALSGTATIGAAGTAILSNTISGAAGANLTTGTSGQLGTVVLSGTNTYAGTTTVAFGTLQFATPASLYNANASNWTPSNITVASGATLSVNIGGANDFSATQAGTLLSNLLTVNNNGLKAGSTFGLDTTNAAAPVIFSTAITNSAGTGGGAVGISKLGPGTLNLSASANSYTGTTTLSNGTLILNGSNTGNGAVAVTNTTPGGTSLLSIRNAGAVGAGSADTGLAPITMNATGTLQSASILEIGATIGTDPGGNHADFSYQVVAPGNGGGGATGVVAGPGQINLGLLGNSNDGVGFAAYNASSLSAPRVVALYTPTPGSTTLATLQEKTQFGSGTGDHTVLGSTTSNNTLVLLNSIDFNGGSIRRFASVRGVGITPEGEYSGAIINSSVQNMNIEFDGNGGLIFDSAASTYLNGTFQVNGGAVFAAANDPAAAGQPGAFGQGVATLQIGTSASVNPGGGAGATFTATTPQANIGFLTDGPANGVGAAPTIISARNIAVGGTGVTYATAVLGGASNDYTAINGNIALNEAATTPTTFFARNGGRVDFGGTISGAGSVVVGGSSVFVEGDATAPGIQLLNNGTIAFNGANTYQGPTTVSTGTLLVNGSTAAASTVSVSSGAILGGAGTVNGAVSVRAGGTIQAAGVSTSTLTLAGGLTFNGAATINFPNLQPTGSPSLTIGGTLNTNSNSVTLNITGTIAAAGNYALIGYNGVQASSFTLATLPNRAVGTLQVVNGNELDLDVTSAASSLYWTGKTNGNGNWDTTSFNWTVGQGGASTQYIDSPGDSVVFDDTAAPTKGAPISVTINGADLHPTSVTFNNINSTYTLSGPNSIAGALSGGLNVNGTGPVILLNANTFTGPTAIAPGATLQLGNGATGNDGAISNSSSITDNGSLIYNIAGSQTYTGIISGSGSLAINSTAAGTGILTLTNADTYGNGTTIGAGATLQLGNGGNGSDGSITGNVTDNGTLTFNYHGAVTFNGAISGSGQVTKTGIGSVTLNNPTNPFGNLSINQGTVIVPNGAFPGAGGAVTAIGSGLITIGGTLQLSAGSTSNVYALANNVALAGGIFFSSGGVQHLGMTGTAVSVGASGGTLENQFSGQDLFVDGQLTGSGPLALINSGGAGSSASTIHFTNDTNTYSGTVTANGTSGSGLQLSIDTNNTLANATVNVNGTGNGSTLLFGTGATTPTLGALAGNGNFGADVPLSVGKNNASTTYSGVLSGAGSLTKVGSGIMTLTGGNTYQGGTTILAGTMLAGNGAAGSATGTGAVAVQNAGSTLGSAPSGGSIAGPASLSSGASLQGNSTGTLAFASTVTLTSGASFKFVLNAVNGAAAPMISVPANDLTVPAVPGGTVINLVNGGAEAAGTYYLIGYGAGGADPYADFTLGSVPAGFSYALVDDTANSSIDLTTAVPEPTSGVLLAVGTLGLLTRRRRRARSH